MSCRFPGKINIRNRQAFHFNLLVSRLFFDVMQYGFNVFTGSQSITFQVGAVTIIMPLVYGSYIYLVNLLPECGRNDRRACQTPKYKSPVTCLIWTSFRPFFTRSWMASSTAPLNHQGWTKTGHLSKNLQCNYISFDPKIPLSQVTRCSCELSSFPYE